MAASAQASPTGSGLGSSLKTPRAGDINVVASEVFSTLAKGSDAIAIEDFRRCATVLAQLSEDFATDPSQVLERMDENGDNLIQREEFLQEVHSIAELVGMRRAMAALQEVRAVAQKFQGEVSAPATGAAGQRPASGLTKPVFGPAARGGQSEGPGLELDIRQKPLHRRGGRGGMDTLKAREKVLQNMIGYFQTLRASYEEQLQRVQGQQGDLTAQLGTQAEEVPPLPRIFADVAARPRPPTGSFREEGEDGGEGGAGEAAAAEAEEETEDEAEEEEEEEGEEEGESGAETPAGKKAGPRHKKATKQPAGEEAAAAPVPPEAPEEAAAAEEATTPAAKAKEGSLQPSSPAAKPAKKKAKKKKKQEPKPAKERKQKPETRDAEARRERPATGRPATSSPASPSPEPARSTPTPKGQSAPRQKAQGRAKPDEEGVSCVQTLELGLAIRSAICVKKDVWCADWKGNVTIRTRDDASSIQAEIPTNRFVWCMAHQEPGLIWMGQEAQGISLFSTLKKEFKVTLMGGHTGGVTCLAVDEMLGDEEDGRYPIRRAWSGSNDFTIRQWWIETWPSKRPVPEKVAASPGSSVVSLGALHVGIVRGMQMHGHTNGVRALLRIGPILWSGSDDGTIRLWYCADGSCAEVIQDAHKGSVLRLTVVRSYVWSAGSDGLIKEWQLGGNTHTQCVRQVAPPGSEKGVYAVLPLGKDVWSCGHHPNIQVFSQSEMAKFAEYPAHEPYISNLLPVDRVETRIVWSTSLGDRKLKVWRHTIRGSAASIDELKAANRLYEEEEQTKADRMGKLLDNANQLQDQLEVSAEEYKAQLDGLAQQLAEEQVAREASEARAALLEGELAGLRRLFEEAGLGHLLEDPEALRSFLDLKRQFEEAGLGHLLKDPEALKKFLGIGELFKEAGLGALLEDPEALRAFLARAGQIEEILRSLGLEDALRDPQKLREMLESFLQLKQLLESYGFGAAVQDPSVLAEVLSRYSGMQKAFEENGFPELFEDPYTLKGFLRNYARIREEFRNVDLEYLLDSAPAMRDFLAKHGQGELELKDLRQAAAKLELVEKNLAKTQAELKDARAEIDALKAELKQYKDLCPDIEKLRQWKEEAGQFRTLMKMKKATDSELEEMRRLLEEKERERQEALERERLMAMKYKELDIFKLDIIARELKELDNELGLVGKPAKSLQADVAKLRNYDEQQQLAPYGEKILDQCRDLRAHIRDVIHKCLSETQKMHIGVAIDDHLAAGELRDGGIMAGYVLEEVEVPAHGSSKAAKLRQSDEMSRERAMRRSPQPT